MTTLQITRSSHLSNQESATAFVFVNMVYQQLGQQVRAIILFGSRARREAQPDSDMDILVVLSDCSFETKQLILNLAVDVWLEHGILVSTLVWSLAHWHRHAALQTTLYKDLQRDGINLLNLAFSTQAGALTLFRERLGAEEALSFTEKN